MTKQIVKVSRDRLYNLGYASGFEAGIIAGKYSPMRKAPSKMTEWELGYEYGKIMAVYGEENGEENVGK